MCLRIRWMIRADMPEVMQIENLSYEIPWVREDFQYTLSRRNCISLVAEVGRDIAGFVVYQLEKENLRILNIAVHPSFRRQGVASAIIRKLKDKLTMQRRKRLLLECSERNLGAHKFFKSQGFIAYSVLRGYYELTNEDAYAFRFTLDPADDITNPYCPWNRITAEAQ